MNSYQTLSAYYDRFTDDVGYEQWADFFVALFAREGVEPKIVLDLACGTGSLTRLLAQRGYDMIGVDASPEMLMQAMQNTFDCEPRPLFLNQRMEQLDLYGTVDVCLCCLDSVNYVTEPAVLQLSLIHISRPILLRAVLISVNCRWSSTLTCPIFRKPMSIALAGQDVRGRRERRFHSVTSPSVHIWRILRS